MRFPSIKNVAAALRDANKDVDSDDCGDEGGEPTGVDVRLQVYPNGDWALRVGLSDYDQDHRGYWGASCVDGKRFNSRYAARDLIDQAREQCATDENSKLG